MHYQPVAVAAQALERDGWPGDGTGLMLQGSAEEYAESAPWLAIWPGVAITLAVFGFNLFGDALRDILDPKLPMR
jgi:peptide/nickel transport system permease protein